MFLINGRSAKQYIGLPVARHTVITYCSLCARFGMYIVFARALGTQKLGTFLLIQWSAALILPIIGIGMTPLASCTLAQIGQSETARSVAGIFHLLWRLQCRRILFYCLAYIPLAAVLALLTRGALPLYLLLIAGLGTLPLLLSAIVSTTLQGLRHYDLLAGIRFFNTLLQLSLVLVAVRIHGNPLGMLLLAPALANIITLTLALLCIVRLLPLHTAIEPGPLLRERVERGYRPTWLLFLSDSVIWRELLFFLLLLTYWHIPAMLSFYALGILLCTRLIKVAPRCFENLLVPLQSRRHSIRQYSVYTAFVRTTCTITSIAAVLCLALAFCCPLLIETCFGAAYLPVVLPLRILLIAVVFASSATVGLTYLTQNARRREQLWLGVGTAVLHLGLGIPCILMWGVPGAALASTIAHIVSSTSTFLLCRRHLVTGPHLHGPSNGGYFHLRSSNRSLLQG